MASAKELKLRLRAHVGQRIRDAHAGYGDKDYYTSLARGAIWAANVIDAITDKERDEYLDQLKHQQHGQPAPMQRAA